MQNSGATEKWTIVRPQPACASDGQRTRSAISPQRITTSAELPRKVARSTVPLPAFVPFSRRIVPAEKLDVLGAEEQRRRQSFPPLDTAPRDQKCPAATPPPFHPRPRLPLLLTCTGTKLAVPEEIGGDPVRRTEVELRRSTDFEQSALMHEADLVR